MVVIGIDSHKRTHTAVATDGNGRRLAEVTVAATGEGHLDLVRWAGRFTGRRFALEDTRHLSRRLASDLLRAGETVAWVATRHPERPVPGGGDTGIIARFELPPGE